MSYNLSEINERAVREPQNFARECEEDYESRVKKAAAAIQNASRVSPIVFLSGPSGAGKTTTAKKICTELLKSGIRSHAVSLDKYYLPMAEEDSPLTEDGEIDYESPHRLDLRLINEHYAALERGEDIIIPHYDFKSRARDTAKEQSLKLGRDEVVIFEGIHALSDLLTGAHPAAFKLYISASSSVKNNGAEFFKSTWSRLVRRVVRDEFFRGAGAEVTLSMWRNVRRGELLYVSPYKNKADLTLDSSMPYEIPVLKSYALRALRKAAEGADRYLELLELNEIPPALSKFAEIAPEFVPETSILREFIGGGIYKY